MYFIVFGSVKRPTFGGGSFLDWTEPPIGVFQANTPDDACKAAATERGTMGTFAAIECHIWGVELLEAGARKLGQKATAEQRLADHLDRIAELDEQARQLTQAKEKSADG